MIIKVPLPVDVYDEMVKRSKIAKMDGTIEENLSAIANYSLGHAYFMKTDAFLQILKKGPNFLFGEKQVIAIDVALDDVPLEICKFFTRMLIAKDAEHLPFEQKAVVVICIACINLAKDQSFYEES